MSQLITWSLWVFEAIALVGARVLKYEWDVTYELRSPDTYKKLVITVNGKTPGPTILARQGDTVVIQVTNGLETENLAIHWRRIRQIGSPWSDGTEGVTQCPIMPGETFTYHFVVDRALTLAHRGAMGGLSAIATAITDSQTSAGQNYIAVSLFDGL